MLDFSQISKMEAVTEEEDGGGKKLGRSGGDRNLNAARPGDRESLVMMAHMKSSGHLDIFDSDSEEDSDERLQSEEVINATSAGDEEDGEDGEGRLDSAEYGSLEQAETDRKQRGDRNSSAVRSHSSVYSVPSTPFLPSPSSPTPSRGPRSQSRSVSFQYRSLPSSSSSSSPSPPPSPPSPTRSLSRSSSSLGTPGRASRRTSPLRRSTRFLLPPPPPPPPPGSPPLDVSAAPCADSCADECALPSPPRSPFTSRLSDRPGSDDDQLLPDRESDLLPEKKSGVVSRLSDSSEIYEDSIEKLRILIKDVPFRSEESRDWSKEGPNQTIHSVHFDLHGDVHVCRTYNNENQLETRNKNDSIEEYGSNSRALKGVERDSDEGSFPQIAYSVTKPDSFEEIVPDAQNEESLSWNQNNSFSNGMSQDYRAMSQTWNQRQSSEEPFSQNTFMELRNRNNSQGFVDDPQSMALESWNDVPHSYQTSGDFDENQIRNESQRFSGEGSYSQNASMSFANLNNSQGFVSEPQGVMLESWNNISNSYQIPEDYEENQQTWNESQILPGEESYSQNPSVEFSNLNDSQGFVDQSQSVPLESWGDIPYSYQTQENYEENIEACTECGRYSAEESYFQNATTGAINASNSQGFDYETQRARSPSWRDKAHSYWVAACQQQSTSPGPRQTEANNIMELEEEIRVEDLGISDRPSNFSPLNWCSRCPPSISPSVLPITTSGPVNNQPSTVPRSKVWDALMHSEPRALQKHNETRNSVSSIQKTEHNSFARSLNSHYDGSGFFVPNNAEVTLDQEGNYKRQESENAKLHYSSLDQIKLQGVNPKENQSKFPNDQRQQSTQFNKSIYMEILPCSPQTQRKKRNWGLLGANTDRISGVSKSPGLTKIAEHLLDVDMAAEEAQKAEEYKNANNSIYP